MYKKPFCWYIYLKPMCFLGEHDVPAVQSFRYFYLLWYRRCVHIFIGYYDNSQQTVVWFLNVQHSQWTFAWSQNTLQILNYFFKVNFNLIWKEEKSSVFEMARNAPPPPKKKNASNLGHPPPPPRISLLKNSSDKHWIENFI